LPVTFGCGCVCTQFTIPLYCRITNVPCSHALDCVAVSFIAWITNALHRFATGTYLERTVTIAAPFALARFFLGSFVTVHCGSTLVRHAPAIHLVCTPAVAALPVLRAAVLPHTGSPLHTDTLSRGYGSPWLRQLHYAAHAIATVRLLRLLRQTGATFWFAHHTRATSSRLHLFNYFCCSYYPALPFAHMPGCIPLPRFWFTGRRCARHAAPPRSAGLHRPLVRAIAVDKLFAPTQRLHAVRAPYYRALLPRYTPFPGYAALLPAGGRKRRVYATRWFTLMQDYVRATACTAPFTRGSATPFAALDA